MGRWKLTFEYDGSKFSGWQKQPDIRTVEGEVEKAFSTLFQTEIDVIGQGRTDAGVHARAQTAHADLPGDAAGNSLLHAMKGLLPRDLALIEVEKAEPDFHARFHAVSRRYSYITIGRKSPLLRDRAWHFGYTPDVEILKDLAESVAGEHDFINFCIPPDGTKMTTTCLITESRWVYEGELLTYRIEANRFLRHMARRLVGSMVKAASGEIKKSEFLTLLNSKEVSEKAYSAPPHALYLDRVIYS